MLSAAQLLDALSLWRGMHHAKRKDINKERSVHP